MDQMIPHQTDARRGTEGIEREDDRVQEMEKR